MESVSKQMSSKILYIVSFFSSRLKVCLFFFSTNTICVQLISTIIRNQFDTIYNLLQQTKSTIARHFFLRTHICFLPPPASHFTSKAGLALRFKPRAKMCSNMSTRPAKIGKREDAFINLPGEWS